MGSWPCTAVRRCGSASAATVKVSTAQPANIKNGACHPNFPAKIKPAGTPRTEAMGNADITTLVARPRRSGGITSAIMALTSAPASPPKAPAARRATSSQWWVGAKAQASVVRPNPV